MREVDRDVWGTALLRTDTFTFFLLSPFHGTWEDDGFLVCGRETSSVVLLRGRAAIFHTYRSRARPLFDICVLG